MNPPKHIMLTERDCVPLKITNCHFVGDPTTIHFHATTDGIFITDMLLIAGKKLRWSTVFQLKLRPVWYVAKRVRAFFKAVSA